MNESPLAATRRSVALYAGGALGVSLAVAIAVNQFSPALPQRPAPTSEPVAAAPAEPAAPQPTPNQPPATVNAAFEAPVKAPSAPADEASLMVELRSIKQTDPKRALELAREGNRRFPESNDAAERASIIVHALADLGSPSEARGEAEDMVNRYPDGQWVREVELFTGAHRHRSARLDSDGKLEFY